MPELPEVETVVRGLRTSLIGHTFTAADVMWERSIASPDADHLPQRLTGQTVTDVTRRGKWIVIALDSGDSLLIHLRMSGRLILTQDPSCLETRHLRVLFSFENGRRLSFIDQRKFGRIHLTADPERVLGTLGPEPLDDTFTMNKFREMLKPRRGRLKPLLLNQRFLAGLGNIYTDESLWKARLHPLRKADTLTETEIERLYAAIRSTLQAAIVSGGTTWQDQGYRQANGGRGQFAPKLIVYGQAEAPCPRCATPIQRIKVAQRGTHICPQCQQLSNFKN